jgi:hypothetical protein
MNNNAKSRQPIDWQAIPRCQMAPGLYDEIVTFFSRAYELASLMATYRGGTHGLHREGGRLVSHALWVTRRFQVGSSLPLRAAEIEAVATDRHCRLSRRRPCVGRA